MTPEQLLGLPAPISELTDDQLTEHLKKFFPWTRPPAPMSHAMSIAKQALPSASANEDPNSYEAKLRAAYAAQGLDPTGTKMLPKEKKKLTFN